MANAEVCSHTARLNNELRSSPKDKAKKNVGRKLTYEYVYYLGRTCKVLIEIVTNYVDAQAKVRDVDSIRLSSLADEKREAIYLKHSKGAMVLRSTSSPKEVHRKLRN